MAFAMTKKLKAEIDELANKFRALIRQRDGLDRQIEAIKIRLEAFQDAYEIVSGQSAVPEQNGETTQGRIRRPVINHADPWEDALIVLEKKGGEFTTDQIIAEAKSRGSDIERVRARSRLAHLCDRGTLKRVREGVFEFPKDEART